VKGAEKDKNAAGGCQIRESADFQTSINKKATCVVSAKCKWTEWSAFCNPKLTGVESLYSGKFPT
jgi:hypothetical protein